MYTILMLEMFEMSRYFISNWSKLVAICHFVNARNKWQKYVVMNILFRFPAKILGHREGIIVTGQSVLLQPFSSRMSVWKMISFNFKRNQNKSTVHLKVKRNSSVGKSEKAAVIRALRSMDLEGHPLSRDLPSPRVSDRAESYWLACLEELPRCSRVILVWHIATSLCAINLANDRRINLTSKFQKAHDVANFLSEYCMYLLIAKPKLLPETILMSKKTCQDAVQCAQEMLKDCHSYCDIYKKLMKEEQKALVPGTHDDDVNLSGNIL